MVPSKGLRACGSVLVEWLKNSGVLWGLQTSGIPLLINVGESATKSRRKVLLTPNSMESPWPWVTKPPVNTLPNGRGKYLMVFTCGRAQQTLIFSQRLQAPKEKIFTVSNPLHQLLSKSSGLCVRFWLVGRLSVPQHPCSGQWAWLRWQHCPQPVSLLQPLPAFCSMGEVWWIAFGSGSKHIPLKSVFWI